MFFFLATFYLFLKVCIYIFNFLSHYLLNKVFTKLKLYYFILLIGYFVFLQFIFVFQINIFKSLFWLRVNYWFLVLGFIFLFSLNINLVVRGVDFLWNYFFCWFEFWYYVKKQEHKSVFIFLFLWIFTFCFLKKKIYAWNLIMWKINKLCIFAKLLSVNKKQCQSFVWLENKVVTKNICAVKCFACNFSLNSKNHFLE